MLSEESKVTNLAHLSSQHVDRRWIKIKWSRFKL